MAEEIKRPKDLINNNNLGKWMNWSDIVNLYPDRWIYLTDFKLDEGSNIIGGILSVVCSEPEFPLVEDFIGTKQVYVPYALQLL